MSRHKKDKSTLKYKHKLKKAKLSFVELPKKASSKTSDAEGMIRFMKIKNSSYCEEQVFDNLGERICGEGESENIKGCSEYDKSIMAVDKRRSRDKKQNNRKSLHVVNNLAVDDANKTQDKSDRRVTFADKIEEVKIIEINVNNKKRKINKNCDKVEDKEIKKQSKNNNSKNVVDVEYDKTRNDKKDTISINNIYNKIKTDNIKINNEENKENYVNNTKKHKKFDIKPDKKNKIKTLNETNTHNSNIECNGKIHENKSNENKFDTKSKNITVQDTIINSEIRVSKITENKNDNNLKNNKNCNIKINNTIEKSSYMKNDDQIQFEDKKKINNEVKNKKEIINKKKSAKHKSSDNESKMIETKLEKKEDNNILHRSNAKNKSKDKKNAENHNRKANAITNPNKNIISDNEKALLKKGTRKDQINTLTLIIERNPTNCFEEFNTLLEKCNTERNDFVYYILKNIKDLLLSKLILDENFFTLKKKFINIVEYNLRNIHIKKKVLDLVYQLLKKNVLFLDLIYIFINKIGDKKEIGQIVVKYLKSLYELNINRKIILFGLEEFYHKDLKSRKMIVDFINKIKDNDIENSDLYYTFYENLKNRDFSDKAIFEKTLENIIKGLIKNYKQDTERIIDETLLLNVYNNFSLNFNILLLLQKNKSKNLIPQLIRLLRALKPIDLKHRNNFFNFMYEIIVNNDTKTNVNVLETLISTALFYDNTYIITVFVFVNKIIQNNYNAFDCLFVLQIYKNHYHPVVRYCLEQILQKKEVHIFDPNDTNEIDRIEMIYNK
ncbi:hypothetical protein COBT_000212 [Conglomerata obtusa]